MGVTSMDCSLLLAALEAHTAQVACSVNVVSAKQGLIGA